MIDRPEHGGEVDFIAEQYGIERARWIDISTGINPHPYPLPELAKEYWHRLPDAALTAWLMETAAVYYGIAEPGFVVPSPGSQAIIQWLPHLLPTSRVCIVGPTYTEHRFSWSQMQHVVTEVNALVDIPTDAEVVVVGNPNNPDGRSFALGDLLAAGADRLLIVDEAFADMTPEVSLAGYVGRANVVILRSFGKFFGLAGMRLGFALLDEPLAGRLRQALGPWAVSGPSAAIGAVALSDSTWIRATRTRLIAQSRRLDELLLRSDLQILGGTALYRLIEHPRAGDLFDLLARSAILVRRFAEHPHWLRFGIPGSEEGFSRLGEALATWSPPAPLSPSPSISRLRSPGTARPSRGSRS